MAGTSTSRICPITSTSNSDRKSTRLNSSHTVIYTLSLHDALPILLKSGNLWLLCGMYWCGAYGWYFNITYLPDYLHEQFRSEEHTSELQSHSDLHSFPTRRSSDLVEKRQPLAPLRHVLVRRVWLVLQHHVSARLPPRAI